MKPLRLLIAAVLLAVVGGVLWWSNRDEKAKEGKPAADAPPQILSIKPDQVKQLEIHRRGEDAITLVFNDKGKWEITTPKPYPADSGSIAALTSPMSNLASERMVDAKATDLASYGLAPPLVEVTITDKEGKKTKLLIGEKTPTGDAVYAKLDGDPRLFTMASSHRAAFEKEVNDFRDKRLLPFGVDKLSKMELRTPKQDMEFARTPDGAWSIVKPQAMRADSGLTDDLMNKVRGASMDLSEPDTAKTAALFNVGTPVGTVSVTDETGTKSLEIRKNKDDYYAKSSAQDAIYKTSKDVGNALEKSLDDFRNKKIFDFAFNDPTRIEIADGAKNVILDRSNTGKGDDKWVSAGKTMDSTSVQQFIDKLRDLTATKFVSTGFGPVTLTLSITSNQGTHKERVEISEAGPDRFLARHDGDAGVYELDAKAVKDLRQAEGDIREEQKSAPPKK